ncbi:MAG TPA: DUF5615 family PIN-like protein [Gemmataceae bacterium]|jgi:predicted nuclease of predicted toxin-antitoxin system|nr:DUF5615 family PIN-like protein [Gemmataceae bacterium]
MKLLADESVDHGIIDHLRACGHDVASIAEESPGASDDVILARAFREGVVLLTEDKDFGELVYRKRRPHAGVVLLRVSGLSKSAKLDLVTEVIDQHGDELVGAFAVVESGALRLRTDPAD